jgi:hypothetical protein
VRYCTSVHVLARERDCTRSCVPLYSLVDAIVLVCCTQLYSSVICNSTRVLARVPRVRAEPRSTDDVRARVRTRLASLALQAARPWRVDARVEGSTRGREELTHAREEVRRRTRIRLARVGRLLARLPFGKVGLYLIVPCP